MTEKGNPKLISRYTSGVLCNMDVKTLLRSSKTTPSVKKSVLARTKNLKLIQIFNINENDSR